MELIILGTKAAESFKKKINEVNDGIHVTTYSALDIFAQALENREILCDRVIITEEVLISKSVDESAQRMQAIKDFLDKHYMGLELMVVLKHESLLKVCTDICYDTDLSVVFCIGAKLKVTFIIDVATKSIKELRTIYADMLYTEKVDETDTSDGVVAVDDAYNPQYATIDYADSGNESIEETDVDVTDSTVENEYMEMTYDETDIDDATSDEYTEASYDNDLDYTSTEVQFADPYAEMSGDIPEPENNLLTGDTTESNANDYYEEVYFEDNLTEVPVTQDAVEDVDYDMAMDAYNNGDTEETYDTTLNDIDSNDVNDVAETQTRVTAGPEVQQETKQQTVKNTLLSSRLRKEKKNVTLDTKKPKDKNTKQEKQKIVKQATAAGPTMLYAQGTKYAQTIQRQAVSIIVVTGDRRSGVTSTAMMIAEHFAKKVPTLYVDFDVKFRNSIFYLGVDDLSVVDSIKQNGLGVLEPGRNVQTVAFRASTVDFDSIVSMPNYTLTDDQLRQAQLQLYYQRDYNAVVIDCPLSSLYLIEDLLGQATVYLCINGDIASCNSTLQTIDVVNPLTESIVGDTIHELTEKGIAMMSRAKYLLTGTVDVNTFWQNMQYLESLYSMQDETLNWTRLQVAGERSNLDNVIMQMV
jgi:hypothetical protein